MNLEKNNDMIVIIDMVNGFAKEGNMASPLVYEIINPIKKLIDKSLDNGIKVIHYTDSHPSNAQEFKTYPIHCLENTSESLPVDELNDNRIEIIKKNSTNGFLAFNPFTYQKNLFVCGCVTDICVFEFCLTAQKYKEEYNLPYSVNLIKDLVQTYDGEDHEYSKINSTFINMLKQRGINIV
ncbi:MAG: cysteine hydrolase [Bacilli bacterium]|jgi:nicotinamidase-related amidase|nr:cysteine hydrolase [Bacilli bacterium]